MQKDIFEQPQYLTLQQQVKNNSQKKKEKEKKEVTTAWYTAVPIICENSKARKARYQFNIENQLPWPGK